MAKSHLPSIEALTSGDDERLQNELKMCEVRDQVAVARALLDELERLVPVSADGQAPAGGQGQVAEELARLGCTIMKIATTLTRGEGRRAAPPTNELGAGL